MLRVVIFQVWQIIFNITFLLCVARTKINATNFKMFYFIKADGYYALTTLILNII
jgi:hypothetical protein